MLQLIKERIFQCLEWIGASVQKIFTAKQYRTTAFWLIVLGIFSCTLLLSHCGSKPAKNHKGNAMPVVAATARTRDVPVYLTALGSVIPSYSVTVKPQINGQLIKVLFREGQMVNKGDLLAEIDPRPYEAQLTQYQGQLARDRALLANTRLDLKRYQTLWHQDSVAKQVLDTQAALVKQNEGTVELDEGLLQTAQVNLAYTKIISPISGRVGLRLVDPGNFVQTSDVAGIAVINMLNPITVVFTIPEDNVPEVFNQMTANTNLPVYVYNREQNKLLDTGQLITMDNQIDPTTGTIKLKAQFDNKTNQLFPNQFVNVKLLVKTLRNVILVPTASIQQGSKGPFVYLINKDATVSIKPVTVGVSLGDETVVTGIASGQSVVVEGADKLIEGAKVTLANETEQQSVPENKKQRQRHSSLTLEDRSISTS